MSETSLEEYKRLLEKQGRALVQVIQSVALGDLDVEVEIPEGIQMLSELAAGLEMMIDRLRKEKAEQERAAEGQRKALAEALQTTRELTEERDETRRRLEEQTALREAGLILTSALDQSTVLTRLAEQVCRAVDGTSTYISSYDPETTAGVVLAEYYGPEACAKERVSDLGESYGVEESVALVNAGVPHQYHVDDPDLAEFERAALRQYGGQSVLIVPLQLRARTIAYVELWDSRGRREFTPEEIALCQSVVQQAAMAIENARLIEQTQARVRREQVLREITTRVRTFTDSDVILRAAVRELGAALGRPAFVLLGSAEELSPVLAEVNDDDQGMALRQGDE